MVATFETAVGKKQASSNDEFGAVIWALIKSVPWKIAICLFLLFIVINSTIFIEYCIEPFGNTYASTQLTDKGIYLQGLFLSIGYIVLNTLVSYEIL